MKKKEDELLNSNYDGIQEYDNDLPKWWQALFYITIVFAAVYSFYYFKIAPSSEAKLQSELQLIAQSKKPVSVGAVDAKTLLALAKDPSRVAAGKQVFQARCAACHGDHGQGIVGPNLADEYWIHGGKIEEIEHTIEVGVPEKGMLAWKGIMTDDEIYNVVAFVHSLAHTNPPNPKAPQGDKYEGDE